MADHGQLYRDTKEQLKNPDGSVAAVPDPMLKAPGEPSTDLTNTHDPLTNPGESITSEDITRSRRGQ